MNTIYAKPDDNGKPVYATTSTICGPYGIIVNPSEKDYLMAGYFPFVDEPPAPEVPEGKIAVKGDYALYDMAWHNTWQVVDQPTPPPRQFSKLKITMALADAEVWSQVKQWIIDNGMYDFYLAAQDFAEDNDQFKSGKAAVQQLLGWNDAQTEELLSRCIL